MKRRMLKRDYIKQAERRIYTFFIIFLIVAGFADMTIQSLLK